MPWQVVKPVSDSGALELTRFESRSVVVSAKIIYKNSENVASNTSMNIFTEYSKQMRHTSNRRT
jgi:hypothetical protein